MVEHAGTGALASVRLIGPEGLVALLEGGLDRVLLIDSRPFVDYNTSHILEAVNVNCSKLMKRRLQQDKVQIAELLQHSAKKKVSMGVEICQVCFKGAGALFPESRTLILFRFILKARDQHLR